MVGNIADTPDKYNYHTDVREVREESKKISGVVNVLFTAFGVFGAVFVLSSHVFNEIGWVRPSISNSPLLCCFFFL